MRRLLIPISPTFAGAAALVVLLSSCVSAEPTEKWAKPAPETIAESPRLPQEWIDSVYDPPEGGTVHNVRSDCGNTTHCLEDLQAALDVARQGDIIEIEAGATFVGNYILRKKSGDKWIHVRSSTVERLPLPGMRVSPRDAPLMPKIVSHNSLPAITAEFGAHHYRLVGLEITTTNSLNYNLVVFGRNALTTNDAAESVSQLATDVVLDRCYVHGTPEGKIVRGILFDVRRGAVVDSYLSDFHHIGFDTQAICSFNGSGPIKIVNNYLEAAGENIMFGGMAPNIPGLVPSDIEIRFNYFFKPLRWKLGHSSYVGKEWTIKNLLELKNARRVLVENNVFENTWRHAQDGSGIVFTPRSHGSASWSTVEDVHFVSNIVRNTKNGFQLLSEDDQSPSEQMKRVVIQNNLVSVEETFFRFVSWYSGRPARPVLDLSIMHNTCVHSGDGKSIMAMTNWPRDVETIVPVGRRCVVRNNVFSHGQYGVHGSGVGGGRVALDAYLDGYEFAKNILYGNVRNDGSAYPGENAHVRDATDVGFADFAGGDYRILVESPAVGADVTKLLRIETCVISGTCEY